MVNVIIYECLVRDFFDKAHSQKTVGVSFNMSPKKVKYVSKVKYSKMSPKKIVSKKKSEFVSKKKKKKIKLSHVCKTNCNQKKSKNAIPIYML